MDVDEKQEEAEAAVSSDSDSSDSDSDSSSSDSSDSDSDSEMAPATPSSAAKADEPEDAPSGSEGASDPTKDPLHVSNFALSREVKEKLENKGITSLFGIQAQTFQTVLDGKDLVGRARTGCGKTLAVVALEGEEIEAGSRVGPHGGAKHCGVGVPGDDGAAGQLCDLAGLEAEHASTDFTFYEDFFH
mgnify:CR=1 FL=1